MSCGLIFPILGKSCTVSGQHSPRGEQETYMNHAVEGTLPSLLWAVAQGKGRHQRYSTPSHCRQVPGLAIAAVPSPLLHRAIGTI